MAPFSNRLEKKPGERDEERRKPSPQKTKRLQEPLKALEGLDGHPLESWPHDTFQKVRVGLLG